MVIIHSGAATEPEAIDVWPSDDLYNERIGAVVNEYSGRKIFR